MVEHETVTKADVDSKIATHKGDASAHHTKYAPPSGLIALWHGTIANIPSGYVICDGNNSTPNLLTKFVQGVATAVTDPGATGGAATHTHTTPGTASTTGIGLKIGTGTASAERVDHSHLAGETGSESGLPPFYDVAFLMKT